MQVGVLEINILALPAIVSMVILAALTETEIYLQGCPIFQSAVAILDILYSVEPSEVVL